MTDRMLIDAVHPEETRVVVMRGNQVEEFDFESENKRPIRGNIYLAQVTRVEPSLQAAFVEYGGNRHGFLAFSEIHPDFYQIPLSDREALLQEHAAEDRESADNEDASLEADGSARDAQNMQADADGEHDNNGENGDNNSENGGNNENGSAVEDLGGDAHEEASTAGRIRALSRKYKIQEVIKRRQVILVQAVKEERGNKGAALTTYLSLAGRYCVLMPNTARGGGISRKISNQGDRKKLKKIVEKLDVPNGMGLIIRTAGSQRTSTEIKRDFEYLIRVWKKIRELTLESSAPALVYEEGSLINRSIRDLYNKDFEEILIDGEEGYKDARDYMKLLIPSHARKIKAYKERGALFQEQGIEDQLAAMFNPAVTLPSGGYLVINQTEALVAVDVNSGRATKEHSIEKTALKTNLEAATEIARQMRLRDLAGLLVIDFIDMDENRNNRAVERRLKDALKIDRARIQVGKISPFGLLEMSRQRMRSGVLEGSSIHCEHCNGTGIVRSVESRALHVLRHVEQETAKLSESEARQISVRVPLEVAGYILNQKRSNLVAIETASGCNVVIQGDSSLNEMQMSFTIGQPGEESGDPGQLIRMDGNPEAGGMPEENKSRRRRRKRRGGSGGQSDNAPEFRGTEAAAEESEDEDRPAETDSDTQEEDRPRRRRRGRRGGRRRRQNAENAAENNEANNEADNETNNEGASETASEPASETSGVELVEMAADAPMDMGTEQAVEEVAPEIVADTGAETLAETVADTVTEIAEEETEKPKRRRRTRKKPDAEKPTKDSDTDASDRAENDASDTAEDTAEDTADKPEAKKAKAKSPRKSSSKTNPRASRAKKAKPDEPATDEVTAPPSEAPDTSAQDGTDDGPKKSGWWNR